MNVLGRERDGVLTITGYRDILPRNLPLLSQVDF